MPTLTCTYGARSLPRAPPVRHSDQYAALLDCRQLAQKAVGLRRRPGERMVQIARKSTSCAYELALLRGSLHGHQQRQKRLALLGTTVLAQRLRPSGTCCALAARESRVVYVAKNANGCSAVALVLGEMKHHAPDAVPHRAQTANDLDDAFADAAVARAESASQIEPQSDAQEPRRSGTRRLASARRNARSSSKSGDGGAAFSAPGKSRSGSAHSAVKKRCPKSRNQPSAGGKSPSSSAPPSCTRPSPDPRSKACVSRASRTGSRTNRRYRPLPDGDARSERGPDRAMRTRAR